MTSVLHQKYHSYYDFTVIHLLVAIINVRKCATHKLKKVRYGSLHLKMKIGILT